MKSYYQKELFLSLNNKILFLDTSSLIFLFAYEVTLKPLVVELEKIQCKFLTIPSVAFEFSRTDSIEGFNKRTDFLKKYLTTFPIEKYLREFEDLTLVLQKVNGRMSYTDFLLYCCLYKFPESYVLTENHRDFLTTILDRSDIITVDNNNQNIRNLALYTFSHDKYEKAAENILRTIL